MTEAGPGGTSNRTTPPLNSISSTTSSLSNPTDRRITRSDRHPLSIDNISLPPRKSNKRMALTQLVFAPATANASSSTVAHHTASSTTATTTSTNTATTDTVLTNHPATSTEDNKDADVEFIPSQPALLMDSKHNFSTSTSCPTALSLHVNATPIASMPLSSLTLHNTASIHTHSSTYNTASMAASSPTAPNTLVNPILSHPTSFPVFSSTSNRDISSLRSTSPSSSQSSAATDPLALLNQLLDGSEPDPPAHQISIIHMVSDVNTAFSQYLNKTCAVMTLESHKANGTVPKSLHINNKLSLSKDSNKDAEVKSICHKTEQQLLDVLILTRRSEMKACRKEVTDKVTHYKNLLSHHRDSFHRLFLSLVAPPNIEKEHDEKSSPAIIEFCDQLYQVLKTTHDKFYQNLEAKHQKRVQLAEEKEKALENPGPWVKEIARNEAKAVFAQANALDAFSASKRTSSSSSTDSSTKVKPSTAPPSLAKPPVAKPVSTNLSTKPFHAKPVSIKKKGSFQKGKKRFFPNQTKNFRRLPPATIIPSRPLLSRPTAQLGQQSPAQHSNLYPYASQYPTWQHPQMLPWNYQGFYQPPLNLTFPGPNPGYSPYQKSLPVTQPNLCSLPLPTYPTPFWQAPTQSQSGVPLNNTSVQGQVNAFANPGLLSMNRYWPSWPNNLPQN